MTSIPGATPDQPDSPISPVNPASSMTADDQHVNRKILEFAKVWAPYGGAHHEDIFVAYGLTPRQYYQRLADLLPTVPSADLTPTQARLIHTQCLNHINAQKSQPESH